MDPVVSVQNKNFLGNSKELAKVLGADEDGFMWSGERLTREQLTSRPDHLWPELWEKMGKHAKLKEKAKMVT